jgi:hypothetical protein
VSNSIETVENVVIERKTSRAREMRDRLFKVSRPTIRPFVADDMWVLWAAYDMESFDALPKGWKREEFERHALGAMARHSAVLVVEDECRYFRAKRGPVAFLGINNFGWRIEPHVDWFRWATPRIRLRGAVAFLQKVRWAPEVGVCVMRALTKDKGFFIHLRKYGVCFIVGDIPGGDPRGDETLFYVSGGAKFAVAETKRDKEKPGQQQAETVTAQTLQAA